MEEGYDRFCAKQKRDEQALKDRDRKEHLHNCSKTAQKNKIQIQAEELLETKNHAMVAVRKELMDLVTEQNYGHAPRKKPRTASD